MSDLDTRRRVERLDTLAHWLDDRFRIPGTNITFGLDPLISLIPGIGDSATAITSFYLIGQAHSLGVPCRMLLRMTINVLADLTIGVIPLIGDIFDIGFKANRRNVELLKRYLARETGH